MCKIKVTYTEVQDFCIGLGLDICISSVQNPTGTLSSSPCQTLIKEQLASLIAVELELSSIVKIHLVVNISRVRKYIGKVEGQKKEQSAPVIIEGKEE